MILKKIYIYDIVGIAEHCSGIQHNSAYTWLIVYNGKAI